MASNALADAAAPAPAPARSSSRPRGSPPRFDSLEQEAFLNLWRTYDRLHIEEDRLFGSFGLTSQQYNALRLLRAALPGSLPTLGLAQRLVSRAPDITRLVDKLAARKLVRRERPAGNRRLVQVRIAEPGLKLLERLAEPVRLCHERQLGHMSRARLRQLVSLLCEARQPHEAPDGAWASDPPDKAPARKTP